MVRCLLRQCQTIVEKSVTRTAEIQDSWVASGGKKQGERGVELRLLCVRFNQAIQLQVFKNSSSQQIRYCSVGSDMSPF